MLAGSETIFGCWLAIVSIEIVDFNVPHKIIEKLTTANQFFQTAQQLGFQFSQTKLGFQFYSCTHSAIRHSSLSTASHENVKIMEREDSFLELPLNASK